SRRRHTRFSRDWSSDVCSSDLVHARVSDLGPERVRLSAQISVPGEPPRRVPLGTLREGADTYGADVPQCGVARCRLVGLVLGRTGAAGPFTARVAVDRITSDGETVAAGLDDPDAWAAAGEGVVVTPGRSLTVEVD